MLGPLRLYREECLAMRVCTLFARGPGGDTKRRPQASRGRGSDGGIGVAWMCQSMQFQAVRIREGK